MTFVCSDPDLNTEDEDSEEDELEDEDDEDETENDSKDNGASVERYSNATHNTCSMMECPRSVSVCIFCAYFRV